MVFTLGDALTRPSVDSTKLLAGATAINEMAGGAPSPVTGGPPSSSTSAAFTSSGLPPPPAPPKILLAKPTPGPAAPCLAARDDDPSPTVVLRSRNAPQPGSLNLLSDSWELHTDRVLPFLTENSDFTVIGVIGPPGVGKSTIMNVLYGLDGSSPGMLPPFATQTDETRATAKHCTAGIELRVSAERLILLDTQPVCSPSILADMIRPDGSSMVPILNEESLSADLAHELMGIQLGVFLASICNILLVISEGAHDFNMWQLMLTGSAPLRPASNNICCIHKWVDLLKHRIPDPSLLGSTHSQAPNSMQYKESIGNAQTTPEEYLSTLVFVHTKLQEQDLSPSCVMLLKEALQQYFCSSSFIANDCGMEVQMDSSSDLHKMSNDSNPLGPELFVLPLKVHDDARKAQVSSYASMLGKLHDQILSMDSHSFAKTVSEREWLRSSAKIWELVKKSPLTADYCMTLQHSGLFRSPLHHGANPSAQVERRKERQRTGHI